MNQLRQFQRIHFIGIGGAGMSAIASVLLALGFDVQGSDAAEGVTTRKLAAGGARIFIGHAAEHIAGAELVVTSTAIRPENPERQAAEAAGIPIWRRARVLAEIMRGGRSVAVSGTHGKTTTTSMLGLMLTAAQWDPTVLVGGEVNDFGGNARTGKGEWVVAEADESDASFLEMNPDRIIITNVEADHLDFYSGLAEIEDTFVKFTTQMQPEGKVIACLDNPVLARLIGREQDAATLARITAPVLTYSLENPAADMYARAVESRGVRGMRFTPVWRGTELAPVTLRVPGRHNVLDALGALALALDLGAAYEPLCQALAGFEGARRRFQLKGEVEGVAIVDDYAHHPTEIAATLAAARGTLAASSAQADVTCTMTPAEGEAGGHRRVVGIFQPHRFSRTQALAEDFGAALQGTDLLIVTDVYGAGERPIPGVSGHSVFEAAQRHGHRNAHYCPTLAEARAFLGQRLEPGDLFLTIGAGNVYQVGEQVLQDLTARATCPPAGSPREGVA